MRLNRISLFLFIISQPAMSYALIVDQATIDAANNQWTPQSTMSQIKPALKGEVAGPSGLTPSQLINLGRFLFNDETFKGNGRTCATCHPAINNFTIDPNYIATLPSNDPLFVAETKPYLKNLENPTLMRSLGLICENVDGFDQPCVFRAVPHVLALSTSITPPLANPPNPGNVVVPGTTPPVELANTTGWSGDGAPIGNGASGELRLFALGAITQHFTKTLNRVPGIDFRVPSNLELDAILAFLLSLGRQQDVDLSTLIFSDPIAEFGKTVFQDQDINTGARCSLCHNNAGGTSPPNNANSGRQTLANTRIELVANPPAYLLVPGVFVVDGGFGKPPALSPTIPPRIPTPKPGFGDGTFKAPPLIEATITSPNFHNNSAPTIEAAISFFASPEFNNPKVIINLNQDKATGIAVFLRSIGSMELMDRSVQNDTSAIASDDPLLGQSLIAIAIKNTSDAIKILKEGTYNLYPSVQSQLVTVSSLQWEALHTANLNTRNSLLQQADTSLINIKNMIAQ